MQELNSEQEKAAQFKCGIASVLAVPGSGKTLTMTQRIGTLVSNGVAPESILGLTFTRNAADAMKNKLRPVLGAKSKRVHLATIHSFCYKLLREEGKQFELLHGNEQLKFLKKILKKAKVKNLPSGMILREISLAKSNLIDVEEFKTLYQGDQTMQKIGQLMEFYEAEKHKKMLLDFDDLLVKTLDLLKNNQEIRDKYQNLYSHILVDEFQDTNIAQMAILKILIEKIKSNNSSFWVCGDDWQSIYSFTGATVGNILNFQEKFPEANQYILNTNYRSTPQILRVCQNLINHNSRRVEKQLTTNNPDGDEPVVLDAINSEEDEATKIVNEITDLVERHGYRYQNIAVLYRANYQSRVIEEAFSKHNIPYYIENGTNFFERFEVKILLDYLRLIQNPNSDQGDEALRAVINVPNRYIGRAFVGELEEYSENNRLHLWAGLQKMPIQTPYLKRFVKELKNLINPLIKDRDNYEPAELIHALRESLDYDKFISEDDVPSPDDSKIANIDQLQMVASKHRDIESLLNYTDSFKSEISNDKNGVRLMTIHKAKGLEYSIVFLIGLVNGILPNKQGDLEEERRIAFVAISRAMEKLYLSYSQKFMGKTVEKSQFLNEMFND